MKWSVGETSKFLGISPRTLRYYDEIDLVNPTEITNSGYRYYHIDDLIKLQQVLFYRELEFSLKEISLIFKNPLFNKYDALRSQREFLVLKQQHISNIISIIDQTIEGVDIMNSNEISLVENLIDAKKKYAAETRIKFGDTPEYKDYLNNAKTHNETSTKSIAEEESKIFTLFANSINKSPEDPYIQELVHAWQKHISKYYYTCSTTTLSSLGEMYVNDESFTYNIDLYGKGTAKLMSDAIAIYCKK